MPEQPKLHAGLTQALPSRILSSYEYNVLPDYQGLGIARPSGGPWPWVLKTVQDAPGWGFEAVALSA